MGIGQLFQIKEDNDESYVTCASDPVIIDSSIKYGKLDILVQDGKHDTKQEIDK